ncbi:hypothetical protein VAR608DRAFT_2888 [Variovorax sp. HW608]|nr:hypothetical protein VAR608DRAFT_2888 [Variovorax sp. HW608]
MRDLQVAAWCIHRASLSQKAIRVRQAATLNCPKMLSTRRAITSSSLASRAAGPCSRNPLRALRDGLGTPEPSCPSHSRAMCCRWPQAASGIKDIESGSRRLVGSGNGPPDFGALLLALASPFREAIELSSQCVPTCRGIEALATFTCRADLRHGQRQPLRVVLPTPDSHPLGMTNRRQSPYHSGARGRSAHSSSAPTRPTTTNED